MPRCGLCLDLDTAILNAGPRVDKPFSELLRAESQGCPTCKILKVCIERLFDIQDTSTWRFELTVTEPLVNGGFNLDLVVRDGDTYGAGVEVYKRADDHCPWSIFSTSTFEPCDSSSDESLKWAEKQLSLCCEDHQQECKVVTNHMLPARVIDVSGDSTVKVVEVFGDEIEERIRNGEYIALSYCWGPPDQMTTKLTMQTLETYRKGILSSSLPQTLLDAVKFTKRLNRQFLWIDALCIIQRDEARDTEEQKEAVDQDWTQESQKMCLVYQNAELTLAAASTSGCHDGLFCQPRRVEVEGHAPNGHRYHLFARQIPGHDSSYFPLMGRGWPFQERLISRRTLYFGQHELLWQCRKLSTCQCTRLEDWDMPEISFPELYKLPDRDDPSLTTDFARNWHRWIEEFSHTVLGRQSDKLAAVEGLRQYVPPRPQGTYLAGLWEDNLVSDLLWITWDASMSERTDTGQDDIVRSMWRTERWPFPTWSWASITGTVRWVLDDRNVENAIETYLVLKDANPSNSRAGSRLKVEGTLVPRRLSDLDTLWSLKLDYDVQKAGKGFVEPDATVYCLRVLKLQGTLQGESQYWSLALHCFGEDDNVYERIGVLHNWAYWEDHGAPEWWGPDGQETGGRPVLEKQIFILV